MDFDASDAAVIVTINNMEDDRQALQDELDEDFPLEEDFPLGYEEDIGAECDDCGEFFMLYEIDAPLGIPPSSAGICPDCGGICYETD